MSNASLPMFAKNLKALRKEKGWTQQELADRMGIKRAALGAYEEGRSEPRLAKYWPWPICWGYRRMR
jgi:transcriptional regulator with XRE-family HTH domain